VFPERRGLKKQKERRKKYHECEKTWQAIKSMCSPFLYINYLNLTEHLLLQPASPTCQTERVQTERVQIRTETAKRDDTNVKNVQASKKQKQIQCSLVDGGGGFQWGQSWREPHNLQQVVSMFPVK